MNSDRTRRLSRKARQLALLGVYNGIDLSESMVARLRAKPGAEEIGVTIGDFATTTVVEIVSCEPEAAGRDRRVTIGRIGRGVSEPGTWLATGLKQDGAVAISPWS